jgi:hypothetical protein
MNGVLRWFERRGEIALVPPPRLREYAALTDDPDKFGAGYSIEGIRGVAFAIEYCDSHGFTSIRTIRCLGIDTRHPASLTAYCHAREKLCKFRIDRIISIMDLRSGRVVSSDEHQALLAPYLPDSEPEPYIQTLTNVQDATRDGVFALLQLGFANGRLADQPRAIVLEYVKAEAKARTLPLPSPDLLALWIDNLAPQRDVVAAAVERLLESKDRFVRLLPWLLKIARSNESFADQEEALRDLMEEVRKHYRDKIGGWPSPLRASS